MATVRQLEIEKQQRIQLALKGLHGAINRMVETNPDAQIKKSLGQAALLVEQIANSDSTARTRQRTFEDTIGYVQESLPMHPDVSKAVVEAVEATANQVYRAAPADLWVQSIDKYDVNQEARNKAKEKAKKEGQLFDPVPYEDNAKKQVKALLKSQASRDALYEGTFPEGEEPKVARQAFLEFLALHERNIRGVIGHEPPKLEQLLGPEGVRLYKAAVEEEVKSRHYRDAVFLKSTKHYTGAKWDKKMVLWVGGPSAAGKTFGSQTAVEAMAGYMPKSDQDQSGNDVVSVDGGIDREVSQMRQLVLAVTLAKGYRGIYDLHENTKLNVKKHVKNAALLDDELSLVIPETFVESMLLNRFNKEGAYKINEMRDFHNDVRILQAFSEVVPEAGQEDRFKTSVKHSGTTRAWLDEHEAFDASDIYMNNRNLPCESKAYGKKGFNLGRYASKIARENFVNLDPTGLTISIVNDLVFVKRVNGQWLECGFDDHPDFKLANRDFETWQSEKELNPDTADLREWWTARREKGLLVKPEITFIPNDLITIKINSVDMPELAFVHVTRRDFDNFRQAHSQKRQNTLAFYTWAMENQDHLTTPLDQLFEYKKGYDSVPRVRSAPVSLLAMEESAIQPDAVDKPRSANTTPDRKQIAERLKRHQSTTETVTNRQEAKKSR